MKTLYITSSFRHTGKHLVSLGIAKELRLRKKKVGFLSPVGLMPVKKGKHFIDQEAEFFRKMLGIKDAPQLVCPIRLDRRLLKHAPMGRSKKRVVDEIMKAHGKISRGKDVVVVVGYGNIWSGPCIGVDQICLINKMKAKVLVVCPGDVEIHDVIDFMVPIKRAIPKSLIGVVFNRIPRARLESFKAEIATPLKKNCDIDTLGLIQMDDLLGSISVAHLISHVHGRIICGREHLERPVEKFAIGAMNLDSAMRYFRQIRNKAVITGGDRSDIQLAALETSTRCLILTGNIQPAPLIVSRADEKGIPIAVVATDTFTVVDSIAPLFGHTSLTEEVKAKRAAEIVKKSLNLNKILRELSS